MPLVPWDLLLTSIDVILEIEGRPLGADLKKINKRQLLDKRS